MSRETVSLIADGFKKYSTAGAAIPVFSGLSLEMDRGSCLAIMGPNACGKSTLVRILLGIESLDKGAIGVSLGPADLAAAVLQNYRSQLLPWASVRENVLLSLGGSHGCGITEEEAIAHVSDFFDWVGFRISLEQRAYSLSGGQQQAVVLARSTLYHPRLWILDEATSAIDFSRREKLFSFLARRLNGEVSAVFITHDLDDALRIASRIVIFDRGMRLLGDQRIYREQGQCASDFVDSAQASEIRHRIRESLRNSSESKVNDSTY